MAGGLIQLTVYGLQDIFLTGTPQITFFKIVYRRHTNFAMESIEQQFIGDTNFGSDATSIIEKIGDLMNRVYLEIELPKVDLSKNPGKWQMNRESAKKQLDEIKIYYDLIYKYITCNTDMARKLDILLRVNNISMNDIIKTMQDHNFIGNLVKLKQQIHTYTTTSSDFNIGTQIDLTKSIQEINLFDIPTIFNSIVSKINNFDIPSDEKTSLIKKEALYAINNHIYGLMYDFYMKIYETYITQQQIYQAIITDTYTERYKFAWVEEIGHAIIDEIELRIGGQIMDKQTGDWLILFNKLYSKEYQVENYYKMIGNITELTIFNDEVKNIYRLIIPFQFWFCRNMGLSLPLLSLRYHDIMFTVKLKDLSKLCYIEDNPDLMDILNIQSQYNINIVSAKLFIDYVFLDSDERRRFAQSTHEYLVEIVQYEEFNNIDGKQFTAHLDFVHPTKFIIWFAQPEHYRSNLSGRNKCQWNNFGIRSNKTGYSMESTYLRTNSYDRTDPNLSPLYYNYVQPYWYFNNSLTDGLNVYSFALNPMEHQPSSSINLGRIDDFSIVSTFSNSFIDLTKEGDLEGNNNNIFMGVYVLSYNIFRVISGMGGMAFQNST